MEATLTNYKIKARSIKKKNYLYSHYKESEDLGRYWELDKARIQSAIKVIAKLQQRGEISEKTFKSVIEILAQYYINSILTDKMRFFDNRFCDTFHKKLLSSDLI